MSLRLGLAALLLSGCAATVTQAPTGVPAPGGQTATPASAEFRANRAQLRRIGYRNCDGYAIELFAPARLSAASAAQQSLFFNAYAYRGGGAIRLNLPGAAARLQQQTGSGWQEVPMVAAASGASVSGTVAKVPLSQQLGATAALSPGHYRAWLGQFSASRAGGAACAITPVWQFDLS